MTFFVYRKFFCRSIFAVLQDTARFVSATESQNSYEFRDPEWQDRNYMCALYDMLRIMQRDYDAAKWATLSEIDELRKFYQFPSFSEWRKR